VVEEQNTPVIVKRALALTIAELASVVTPGAAPTTGNGQTIALPVAEVGGYKFLICIPPPTTR